MKEFKYQEGSVAESSEKKKPSSKNLSFKNCKEFSVDKSESPKRQNKSELQAKKPPMLGSNSNKNVIVDPPEQFSSMKSPYQFSAKK